ncbi:uncharacterized protein LOC110036905 [Phalaenopsis equestris]|uniref:uncharacterized protein LOC110036905 n=1 Tax=Phalaenopsis equestris TaxID=78828 RepID=UPI0009E4A026|nr:uncharacterized protein LOC110036905 [Phalaenopsis equestris]
MELLRSADEQEILNAFKSICLNKAPGPDGFSSTFDIHAWEVIRKDAILVIQSFFFGNNPACLLMDWETVLLQKVLALQFTRHFYLHFVYMSTLGILSWVGILSVAIHVFLEVISFLYFLTFFGVEL